MELNNNNNKNNNNNNNNDDDDDDDDDDDRAEWKIQSSIPSSCISTISFEETRTICWKSEPVEIFMGSGTENVIDTIFNTILQRFQREFIPDSVELLYYHFQRIDNRRAES